MPQATEDELVAQGERERQLLLSILWRETEGDYYAPSIHVTEHGGIGIDIGGTVVVRPIREWHALATRTPAPSSDIEELVERLRKPRPSSAYEFHRLREIAAEAADTLLAIQGERDTLRAERDALLQKPRAR